MKLKLFILPLFFFTSIFFIQNVYPNQQQKVLNPTQQLEGIDSPVVMSVIKDSSGFMWFTTMYGLVRYDGYQFKSYTYQPGYSSSIPNVSGLSNLFADSKGRIWIGTTMNKLVKFDPVLEKFTSYPIDSTVSPNFRNWISALYEDDSGNIWIGLQYEGLYRFDPEKVTFKLYRQQTEKPIHSKDYVLSFLEMENKNMLVGTGEGLYILDYYGDSLRPFDLVSTLPDDFHIATFMNLLKDADNSIWIGSDIGLFKYEPMIKKLTHFMHDANNPQSLSDNLIRNCFINPLDRGNSLWIVVGHGLEYTTINNMDIHSGVVERYVSKHKKPENVYEYFLDESGLLWLASDNQGVFFIDLDNNPFLLEPIIDPTNEQAYSASAFLTDHENKLWVGTGTGGIFVYDESGELVDHYKKMPNSRYDFPTLIYSIFEDSENDIWISNWADGLYRCNRSINEITKYELNFPIADIPNDRASQLIEDHNKRLWVGSASGLYYLDIEKKNTDEFVWVDHSLIGLAHIRSLCVDNSGSLWFTTDQDGLFCLSTDHRDSLYFIQYKHDPNAKGTISSNVVMSVDCSDDGTLWVGTNNGLNKFIPETKSFEWFGLKSGFDAHFIFWVKADKSGNLWVMTEKGLARFNPEAIVGQRFKRFSEHDGLPLRKIYPYHFDKDREGNFYFGGERGFGLGYFTFHPDSINDKLNIPPVAITGFSVRNEIYPLDTSISYKKHISLKHDQNFISFEFATLDYNDPVYNQHAYMLEGIDDDWIFSGNRRFANYTGLSPGTYIFRVKGSNNDGYWNETGTSIVVSIATPPWRTFWAYIIYFVVVTCILLLLIRFYLRRQRLLQQLELEHLEANKLKEVDSMKSKFFANISHEFRTPLTLILGPLNNLLDKAKKENDKKELSVIKRNALRLHQLINQLLDLSKLEAGKMQLEYCEMNIVEWVRMYVQSFESLARQRQIDFVFETSSDDISCYFDPEKMAQVLNNLLSNAFKFTESGEVKVSITPLPSPQLGADQISTLKRDKTTEFFPLQGEHKGVEITISDTGRGIPSEKLQHIFNRFYQADDTKSRKYEGTGIGLALVKELIELHHGKIQVKSVENKGTAFIINLPLGKDHLKPEEIVEKKLDVGLFKKPDLIYSKKSMTPDQKEVDGDKPDQPILLIVEDNADMRNYIRGYFMKDYKIIEAANGKKGFEMAVDHIPDIIISDVMMPEMNGYELSQKIKAEERTSHIPLVLLTARSSGADKIEGLETGADDFVIKPFDGKELQIRIKNLVDQRKLLREHFRKEFSQMRSFSTEKLPSMDQQFIKKAIKLVEVHLSDDKFNVEEFASQMAMSRVQLHRKLKAIADLSAGDFIRSFRLKKAAEMLASKTGNITEIAFAVGFNNPSWFAESFKKQFGVLPSEYLKK